MAVNVNKETLPEKGGNNKPETKYIRAGNRLARFVSYVELGMHYQMFKGAKAKFESGKKAGQDKPAVLHVALTFEFPNEPYTGDYPLTISTTRQMDNGEFFDAVVVPEALAEGTMSLAYAMKTKFMKFLTRLQEATKAQYTSLAEFAASQVGIMVNVTNKEGKSEDGKPAPVFANMRPEGIVAPEFEDPETGAVKVYNVPAVKGEYCKVFDWDAPTEEAWKALPPWHKKTIKAALNFGGSPIHMLLTSNPELDKIQEGTEDHSAPTEPGSSNNPNPPLPEQDDIPV